jgi:hypothetical protein
MIEVMLLHVTEIRVAKIVEVGRVMDPLFGDIGLESESHHDRSSERWKKKNTQWHTEKEKRQQVFYPAAHMFTIKWSFVVPEMQWVKIFVGYAGPESFIPPLRYFPMPVQYEAMRKVFRYHPQHYAEGDKRHGPEKMMRADRQHQQNYCVRGIEGGGAIDFSPRDDLLLALVDPIGVFLTDWHGLRLIRGHSGRGTSFMIAKSPEILAEVV